MNGGAIALGHPLGCTGNITTTYAVRSLFRYYLHHVNVIRIIKLSEYIVDLYVIKRCVLVTYTTGARCVATLLNEMKRRGKDCRFGVISMCIGNTADTSCTKNDEISDECI